MNSSQEFHPSQSRFNDGRSTLSDFVQGQPDHLPNQTQNKATSEVETYEGRPAVLKTGTSGAQNAVGSNAIASSRRHTAAIASGELRGEEHYTQFADTPAGKGHAQECDEQVESRMISKEEFPQG